MPRLFIAMLLIPALAAAQDAPPAPANIVKLIEQLDSKQFRERERASRALAALDDVPPELEAATRSPSPETARRAALAADAIRWRTRERRWQRDLARINQTGVDLFFDRMVLKKEFATTDRWRTAAELADALAASANKLGYAGCVVPRANWPALPLVTDGIRRSERLARVAVDGLNARASFFNCLVISSGTLGRLGTVRDSIVFVNGDFEGATSLRNSVVVCSGAVDGVAAVDGSIILALGKFGAASSARNSFFQTAGVGGSRLAEGNVYVNVKKADGANPTKNQFVQSDQGPLSLLKWFDPAALGVKVSHADGEAHVDGVTAGTPLAKSGLRAGDAIQLIDGRGWVNADQFARDLRRALARDTALLRIRRGGKVEDVPVRLAE